MTKGDKMQTVCKIDSERVYDRIMRLAEIGKVNETGVKRVALSEEDREAQFLVIEWMKEAGMSVTHDHFGNLIGRKEGKSPNLPSVMIGSHIDSVRNGGRFDGIIGVLGGVEIVQAIHDANIVHDHSIEVVAFCEEEGSRFDDGLFGSRGMVGKINQEHLQIKDENGISRYNALKSFGFGIDPDRIEDSIRSKKDIKLFLEMHIEQGPYLEANNYPVGIVKGIAGPSWYTITIEGKGGHAGTVPMVLRQDPMVGVAKIIVEIERLCKQNPEADTVGTIGRIKSFPGGTNVIPTSVEFSLDLRDINLTRRGIVLQQINSKIYEVCESRGLTYNIEKNIEIDPVECSNLVVETLMNISKEKGIDVPLIVSGAGHDAMLLAEISEIGMVFVRCEQGVSHHPNERADKKDIALGIELLLETVLKNI